jgi:CheY-like chemotaxis protein
MSGSFLRTYTGQADGSIAAPDRSILCVQPTSENLQFLQEALGRFKLQLVETGFDALRLTNQSAFDLFVLDYWLTDWNGVALCRDILKSDPHVPIIFYTVADRKYMARALRAGAAAFLQTPIPAAKVIERVELELARADMHGLPARTVAEQVIEDELRRYILAGATNALTALQRPTRIKAERVFISAGGTRLWFQRLWPQLFASACARVAPELLTELPGGAVPGASARVH